MRLVILTGDDLEHRYVTAMLAEAFPDALKAIVIANPKPQPLRSRIAKYSRRYSTSQLRSRVLAKLYGICTRQKARRAAVCAGHFFPSHRSCPIVCADLVRIVNSHNGSDCEALLDEIRPDIIAVYGTAKIKAPVIRLASVRALNMHTGISPRYRGSDTVFWPLHNQEPEWVGVTIHALDEGIDSGPIILTGRPQLAPPDDEDSLFAKCVIVGARLYVEAIRRVAAGNGSFVPQRLEQGRQYRFADRTVAAEIRVKRLLSRGLLADFAGKQQ